MAACSQSFFHEEMKREASGIFLSDEPVPQEKLQGTLFVVLQVISKKSSAVFIIMAMDTEILPIRPVKRIMQGISVFVMHCEKMSVIGIKLPSAFCTDKTVNFQRLFPVTAGWFTYFS
jgi:hypothetical protein